MQIKFLTLYNNLDNSERNLAAAQQDLLADWWKAIDNSNLKFLPEAKISFKDYSLSDFYDKDKAKQYITRCYGNKDLAAPPDSYCFKGKCYTGLAALYEVLSKQKRFMELIIEVEDNLV